MKKTIFNWNVRRVLWYIAGVFLFFAPFAYYQRFMVFLTGLSTTPNIHGVCPRRPLLYFSRGGGEFNTLFTIPIISILLVIVVAFFFGPLFCSKLCPSGAFSEYLSKIFPKKLQINWTKVVNPAPVRYGFLAGFLLSPMFAGSIAHAFCNFWAFEVLVSYGIGTYASVIPAAVLLTLSIWLILFGLLSRGGRGFCNFMCPVGAVQSLVHSVGARLPFTYKIKFIQSKCTNCNACTRVCPMGCWDMKTKEHNINHCITCRQCEQKCQPKAIEFGRGVRNEGLVQVFNEEAFARDNKGI